MRDGRLWTCAVMRRHVRGKGGDSHARERRGPSCFADIMASYTPYPLSAIEIGMKRPSLQSKPVPEDTWLICMLHANGAGGAKAMNRKSKWLIAAAVVVLLVVVGRIALRGTTEEESDSVAVDASEGAGTPVTPIVEEYGAARVGPSADTYEVPARSQTDTEVTQLFSTPDYNTDGYREAYEQAGTFLASLTSSYSRNMIVKTDVNAIRDFLRQATLNPEGLQRTFNVSPFSDVPCELSSTRTEFPSFTPGVNDVPSSYRLEGRCDESNMVARISFAKSENTFHIALISHIWGSFAVLSLGDWEYALAYRVDDATPRGGTE